MTGIGLACHKIRMFTYPRSRATGGPLLGTNVCSPQATASPVRSPGTQSAGPALGPCGPMPSQDRVPADRPGSSLHPPMPGAFKPVEKV